MLRTAMKPGATLKIGFWLVFGLYVLCPLLFAIFGTSSLSYRAADHERFVLGQHEALQTENQCRLDDCDDVPVVWRDRQTGTVYSKDDFRDHRREQQRRLGATWFIYGTIGCLWAAWYRQRFFGDHVAPNLSLYLLGNVVAVATLLLILPV